MCYLDTSRPEEAAADNETKKGVSEVICVSKVQFTMEVHANSVDDRWKPKIESEPKILSLYCVLSDTVHVLKTKCEFQLG